jgi:hypothetical protein
MDRKECIRRIKQGLQKRSGKEWSVTGGRGTAWGWITINAPPKRRTWDHILKPGCNPDNRDSYTYEDTGQPGGYMRPADQLELRILLGFELNKPDYNVGQSGVSIPAGNDYREEYVCRAEGRTPTRYGEQYWD